jgi:NTE family protein
VLSSVFGGSIISVYLAGRWNLLKIEESRIVDWDELVGKPLRDEVLRRDIRTVPVLKQWLIPWNLFRSGSGVTALEERYHRYVTDTTLEELPEQPDFVLGATDILVGVGWTFTRNDAGDYRAGRFKSLNKLPVAAAVAASSCFPPIFTPQVMILPRRSTGKQRPNKIRLTDGGVYDNLGLQPVWDALSVVLVSDGEAPFWFKEESSPWRRLKRYLAISSNQGQSVRKRWLIARFEAKQQDGAYWGIGSAGSSYRNYEGPGYSKKLAVGAISKIRADMNCFSNEEIGILENHGYALAAAVLQTHASSLELPGTPPPSVPHPELMKESVVWRALKHSHRRRYQVDLVRLVSEAW